ncbi:MAG: hypothetical protein F6K41_31720 [Symploca sp. SIO3E6]|nr:hypothetical protein [Caldora sp. SIO3E6]
MFFSSTVSALPTCSQDKLPASPIVLLIYTKSGLDTPIFAGIRQRAEGRRQKEKKA